MWRASGEKTILAIVALYDNDMLSPMLKVNHVPNYMKRSSDIIMLLIEIGIYGHLFQTGRGNLIEVGILVSEYAPGPSFRRTDYIRRNSDGYRGIGYVYYSDRYYDADSNIALDREEVVGNYR